MCGREGYNNGNSRSPVFAFSARSAEKAKTAHEKYRSAEG
jgi:hypothetical protein